MRTTDFSAAPRRARAQAMVTVLTGVGGVLPALRRAGAHEGCCARSPLWQAGAGAGVIAWFDTGEQAQAFARSCHGSVSVLAALPHGYSNGLWRAEDGQLATIERFSTLTGEQTAPPVRRESRG
ncbi:MAG: hypothetical protein ACR2FV_14805 [Ornithinimicrobium sp.]|uniref:hypothetical protein n=1 Tax=Ornithinimicrobium sp. TaxID=1977084 RepID=UPI003D9B5A21